MGRYTARRLEIRLPVSGLEWCPGCHPERSEGSLRPSSQTLRFAQGDKYYLQVSGKPQGANESDRIQAKLAMRQCDNYPLTP